MRAGVDPGATHEWLTHSYKELHIDPRQHEFAMEPNALHIWPKGTYLLIALPNADKSFTATLILPNEGSFSFDEITNDEEIKSFFEAKFPDSIAVVNELEKQFKNSPTSKLATVRSDKWYDGHSTLLLGDAAHGIIPFYGQGMNAGLEDCFLLMELISSMTSWSEVASSLAASRPKDAAAIAQLSINNFVEMRDKVADEQFLLQKKIERKIHDLYPTVWVQLYTMVTFSHIPYSVALAKGDYQNKVMKEVLKITNVEEKVNAGQLQEVLEVLRLQGVEVE